MKNISIPQKFSATLFDRGWSTLPESMAGILVLSLSGRIDADRLARAVRLTLDAEPILGCRFVESWFRPYWRRYDDLDRNGFCEIQASSDCRADMRRFYETPPDLLLRVLLLRGDSDMLCIKLDHHVGDGKALLEYTSLLADIYNRLENNPGYQPIPNLNGSRSLMQVGDRFSLRDKWHIARHIVKAHKENGKLGHWRCPVPRDEPLKLDHVTWRLDADQADAISEYGYQQRATVSQVLLAAFYLAVYDALPPSTDLPLSVGIAIDLRRYLPSKKASAICNLSGASIIGIDPRSGETINAVVQQIREQMKSQRKYLGLAGSYFAFEALPVIRHIAPLIPYGFSKRLNQKKQQGLISGDHVKGWVFLSHSGELHQDRLVFRGTEIIDAFALGGVFHVPGLLGLGVSGFRGALTLSLGCGPTFLITRLRDRIMELLPK